MKYFQGPPNYWTPGDIKSNVLDKYSPKGISATNFDRKSSMLYAFDSALFADGLRPTNENSTVSAKDVAMIKKMYPQGTFQSKPEVPNACVDVAACRSAGKNTHL